VDGDKTPAVASVLDKDAVGDVVSVHTPIDVPVIPPITGADDGNPYVIGKLANVREL
jgi:hypothetical protein